jgi:hypothetical protein
MYTERAWRSTVFSGGVAGIGAGAEETRAIVEINIIKSTR